MSTVLSIDGNHYLLEEAKDAGALLDVLNRSRKLDYNWSKEKDEPRYCYSKCDRKGAEVGPTVEVALLAWEEVGHKPEPESKNEVAAAGVASAEEKIPF